MKTDGEVELFCYTQDCFFGKDTWDDITITHRGKMYENGVPVNDPFKKIFNIGEVESVSEEIVMRRMQEEPYHVLHKCNGHLFIASCFKDDGEWKIKYSTKGGLPNEGNDLLNEDIAIFRERGFEQSIEELLESSVDYADQVTLMFEAIVKHDPHTLYSMEVSMFGENTFVLLGCNGVVGTLPGIAHTIGCPVTPVMTLEGVPRDWLHHENVEGYVIWFPVSDDRVKIKTKDYWLARSKKDLTPEKIIGAFRSAGYDRLLNKFPEEVAEQFCMIVKEEFLYWLEEYEWQVEHIYELDELRLIGDTDKEIATSKHLTQGMKEFLLNDPNTLEVKAAKSRDKRKRFYQWWLESGRDVTVKVKIQEVIEAM
ncbi:hypothetical protein M316_0022 [Nitrincola phage 1M3-16]|uniref:hypothetical protein n=1 Tax=Nitrincola phage 1M3-16 TaxID=1472912 RepID=UPI000444CCFD|nr:hypothetical protein GJ22_gp130 [Nitrincola phage 1M3-16]AHX01087.1 hypothetical protein M316_0022 [Nitrincola phage 1M3-16]